MNTLATSSTVIAGICLLALAAPAAGQSADRMRSGDWVRVETRQAGRVEGRLVTLDGDSVVVAAEHSNQRVAVAREAVTNVWVSAGEKRQTWLGLGIGLAAGAGVGAILGAVSYDPCESTEFLGCFMAPANAAQAALAGGVVGGFFGLVLGGVAGFATKRHDWDVVGVPTSIGFAPSRGGGLLAVKLTI